MLDKIDLSKSLTRAKYDEELPALQVRMHELHWQCFERRVPVILGFEGWDAAGKGGAIKRITQTLDPRGYTVIPIAAPQGEEKRQHYLWRFWRHVPKAGHITLFDRTWYGRVMVERVEGFCREEDWKRAYREINEFERSLTNFGTVVCKFWLHISREEQLTRFKERAKDVFRTYKLTDDDWRNRDKWQPYAKAIDEMLERTSTTYAPWTVVEANDKYYARIKVLRSVVEAIEKALEERNVAKELRQREKRLSKLAKG
jgi:polyphosphate kinase 2 (PPK2 family)